MCCDITGRHGTYGMFQKMSVVAVFRETTCSARVAVAGSEGRHEYTDRSTKAKLAQMCPRAHQAHISYVSGIFNLPWTGPTGQSKRTIQLKSAALVARRPSARPTPQFFG